MKCKNGDLYQLKCKKTGYIETTFEITRSGSASLDGILKQVTAWDLDKAPIEYDFVADVYFKCDSCTHWWFRGEDYSVDGNVDGYYHLCGPEGFMYHIQAMCFAWMVAGDLLADSRETGHNEYSCYRPKYIKELTDLVLKDYEIIVVPSKE